MGHIVIAGSMLATLSTSMCSVIPECRSDWSAYFIPFVSKILKRKLIPYITDPRQEHILILQTMSGRNIMRPFLPKHGILLNVSIRIEARFISLFWNLICFFGLNAFQQFRIISIFSYILAYTSCFQWGVRYILHPPCFWGALQPFFHFAPFSIAICSHSLTLNNLMDGKWRTIQV